MRQDSEGNWITESYFLALQALKLESDSRKLARKIYTNRLNAKIKALKKQIKELRRNKA